MEHDKKFKRQNNYFPKITVLLQTNATDSNDNFNNQIFHAQTEPTRTPFLVCSFSLLSTLMHIVCYISTLCNAIIMYEL